MDKETLHKFSAIMLGKERVDDVAEEEASEAVEEAANIIIGRGISNINNVFKDREVRITPPGTISGTNIRIASPKLTTFRIEAVTPAGNIYMNIGFAEGE